MHVVNRKKQCASAQYVVKKLTSPPRDTTSAVKEDARGGSVQRLHLLGFPHICVSENLQFATPCGVQIFRGVETKLFLHLVSSLPKFQLDMFTINGLEMVDFEQFDI